MAGQSWLLRGSSWAFIPQKELQDLNNQALLLAREITDQEKEAVMEVHSHNTQGASIVVQCSKVSLAMLSYCVRVPAPGILLPN